MTNDEHQSRAAGPDDMAWLLGQSLGAEGFAYRPYPMVCTNGYGPEWHPRMEGAEVTVCGLAIRDNSPVIHEVSTTCAACGTFLAQSGQALALPSRVAADASRSYWRRCFPVESIEVAEVVTA